MRRLLIVSLVTAAIVSSLASAQAAKPEDVYGGKIMTSDTAYPIKAKSPAAYTAQIKKQTKSTFMEDKENKQWKIYYAAFFRKGVDDLEVTVNMYDVSDGGQRMVESYQQFLTKRGERAIVSSVVLNRSDDGNGYPPNSRIMMTIESGGKVIASTTFTVAGEAKKYSGKVEFTDDEAKGGEIKKDEPEKKPDPPKKDEPKKPDPKKK